MIIFGLPEKETDSTQAYWDNDWASEVAALMRKGESFIDAASFVSNKYAEGEDFYLFMNPLVPNFLSDSKKDRIFYYNSKNELIKFSEDKDLVEKLKYMNFGEALVDSRKVLY